MTPLSSPLSQYWQTVVERLPEGFTETSLSVQAKSVLTFSDFALDSVIAHPEWLAELESASPQADEWRHYAGWLQEALAGVCDDASLMREREVFSSSHHGTHRLGADAVRWWTMRLFYNS